MVFNFKNDFSTNIFHISFNGVDVLRLPTSNLKDVQKKKLVKLLVKKVSQDSFLNFHSKGK